MDKNFGENRFSASESADDYEGFHRNPSPRSNNHKALAVVQDLSWGSFFPLFAVYFKYGPILIYYQRSSRGGLKLGSLLCFFGLAVCNPLKIKDLYYCDTPHVIYWNTLYQVHKACHNQLERIEAIIEKYSSKSTDYIRKLLANNISRTWQDWLVEVILLHSAANQLGKQEKVSPDHVILISRYASLLRVLNLHTPTKNKTLVWSQPNKNKAVLYPLAAVVFSILEVLTVFFKSLTSKTTANSKSLKDFKLGVAAAWGTEGMDQNQKDDLYWWRSSSIGGDRLIYMFEREDIQPTQYRVEQIKNIGIESVALNSKFPGDYPKLLIKNWQNQSILISIQNFCFMSKLAWKSLFADEFSKAVLALVSWQYYSGRKLSNIYKTLNLKGVSHFEEAGMDLISLASDMSDSIRIGTHWGSHTGITSISSRNHQVYFFWGHHDAKIALDSGSMARTILIGGCFLSDHSNKEAHLKARKAAEKMREQGVSYILTLFDNSSPSPEFHRFFLQWLVDDPHLGLLIKSKGKTWKEICNDGLNGLVDQAFKTNRIHIVDPSSSPADTASISDFAVSVISISPVILTALHGSRVIYLDYERVDQGPQKPYCILHSLGLNRCVFYEPELLRKSITDYFINPAANPDLGDPSPILERLDPFCDGKASQRIGEFFEWYLEGLDGGLNTEDSVRSATNRYAEKWGNDKVIRRI